MMIHQNQIDAAENEPESLNGFLNRLVAEYPGECASLTSLPLAEARGTLARILTQTQGIGTEDNLSRVAESIREACGLNAGDLVGVTGLSPAEAQVFETISAGIQVPGVGASGSL